MLLPVVVVVLIKSYIPSGDRIYVPLGLGFRVKRKIRVRVRVRVKIPIKSNHITSHHITSHTYSYSQAEYCGSHHRRYRSIQV